MLITVTAKLRLWSYNEQFVKVALERSKRVMHCNHVFRSGARSHVSLCFTSCCLRVFPLPDTDLNRIRLSRLIFMLSQQRQPLSTSCGDIISWDESRLAQTGPNWPNLAQTGPNWPNLAQTGPNWPNLAQTVHCGDGLARSRCRCRCPAHLY